MSIDDQVGLDLAVQQARKSAAEGGIPIGAVLLSVEGAVLGSGHNRRVQQNSMMRHAEIDCLEAVGRRATFAATTLYSTLMPCYMCAGAVVQFKIPRVVVGEARLFPGAIDLLQAHGVEIVDLDSQECVALLGDFIADNPSIWNEDIGTSDC